MTYIFKSDCYSCGGKKKLKTKVQGNYYTSSCYKCGKTKPAVLDEGAYRGAGEPPAAEGSLEP